MAKKRLSQAEQLARAQVALSGATSNQIISSALASMGYDRLRLQQLTALYAEGLRLYTEQRWLKAKASAVRSRWIEKWREAHREYRLLLGMVPLVLGKGRDIKAAFVLGRAEENKRYAHWRVNVRVSLEAAHSSAYQEALAAYGWGRQRSEQLARLVDVAEAAHVAWSVANGEGQEATRLRDAKLAELSKAMTRLRAVAFMVLEDSHPQLLESMGYLVRSETPPALR